MTAFGRPRPLVCLDLDGCVSDSRAPIFGGFRHAINVMGLPQPPDARLHAMVGPPLGASAPALLADLGGDPADAEQFIAHYRDDYTVRSVRDAATFPGMREAIAALGRDADLAIVTSKPLHFTVPILRALAMDGFVHVEGPPLEGETEPKTVTLGRALDTIPDGRTRPAVMVGDRHHDVDAATAHGLAAIGVLWGFGDADELREAGAQRLVARPDELPDALTAVLDR